MSAYAFRVPPEYAPVPAPDQSGDGALRYYAHGADTLAWRRGFGPMEEPHAEAQRWTTCEWDIGGRGLIDAWATADGYFTSAVTGDLNLPDQMLTFYAHTHSERAAVQALAALQSTRRAAAP